MWYPPISAVALAIPICAITVCIYIYICSEPENGTSCQQSPQITTINGYDYSALLMRSKHGQIPEASLAEWILLRAELICYTLYSQDPAFVQCIYEDQAFRDIYPHEVPSSFSGPHARTGGCQSTDQNESPCAVSPCARKIQRSGLVATEWELG